MPRWLASLGALLMLFLSMPAAAADQAADHPTSLVVAYRSEPAARADFRRHLLERTAPRLRELQRQGIVRDFRIYYSWYHQPQVWDALITLRFPNAAALAQWNALERTHPGGLDRDGLALATPVMTAVADAEWVRNPDTVRDGEVYYVIPYEYANAAEYRDYVRGYVLPQVDGWVREGALSGYELYMNRHPVGPNWDSLFIQKYRDIEAFEGRQRVLDKVRQTLRDDATWQDLHKRKGKIRSETENSIAELIAH